MKINKKKAREMFKKMKEDKLAAIDKMTFGEFLYNHYLGDSGFGWDECAKSYRNQLERWGKEIIAEVLRRNK